jgi:hypothetical protein
MYTVRHNERKLCLVHAAGGSGRVLHVLAHSHYPPPPGNLDTPGQVVAKCVSPASWSSTGSSIQSCPFAYEALLPIDGSMIASRLFQQEWAALATFWQTDDECNFWSWEWWRSVLCVTDVRDVNINSSYCKRNYGLNMPPFMFGRMYFFSHRIFLRSRVTAQWLGYERDAWQEIFRFSKVLQIDLGPIQPFITWRTATLFQSKLAGVWSWPLTYIWRRG